MKRIMLALAVLAVLAMPTHADDPLTKEIHEGASFFLYPSGRMDLQLADVQLPGTATLPAEPCKDRSVFIHTDPDAATGKRLNLCENGVWVTQGEGLTGFPNYSQAFAAVTTVTITHALDTPNILIQCYDTDDKWITPDDIDIDASDPWDAVINFAEAETGRCVVNGTTVSDRYTETFSAVTTVTVTGATHGIGTNMITVACYDDSDPRERVEPDLVTVDDGTNDIVITFYEAETGKCVLQ